MFLQADKITGTSLLSFIKGDAVSMFVDSVISRVLVTGKPYILHYRCDSKIRVHFMRMIVKKEKQDLLGIEHDHIRSRKISPAIPFTEADEASEKKCAICGKVEFKNDWFDALTNRKIFGSLHELKTHSVICPGCDEKVVKHVNDPA